MPASGMSRGMRRRKAFFRELVFTHAVPALFLGVMTIQLLDWLTRQTLADAMGQSGLRLALVMCVNGVIVAAAVRGYQLWRRRVTGGVSLALYNVVLSPRQQAAAVAVGFLCGAASLALLLTGWGLLLLTLFALAVALAHWRIFTRSVVRMLRPGRYARWKDVQVLLYIYITLIFCFSLANASLHMLHSLLGLPDAFLFPEHGSPMVFDAFYFTVVTVTTLGFGDIHPLGVDAKLLVVLEVMSSYLMFALMVGLVTRGVLQPEEASAPKGD